jgi:hypothetical protein
VGDTLPCVRDDLLAWQQQWLESTGRDVGLATLWARIVAQPARDCPVIDVAEHAADVVRRHAPGRAADVELRIPRHGQPLPQVWRTATGWHLDVDEPLAPGTAIIAVDEGGNDQLIVSTGPRLSDDQVIAGVKDRLRLQDLMALADAGRRDQLAAWHVCQALGTTGEVARARHTSAAVVLAQPEGEDVTWHATRLAMLL